MSTALTLDTTNSSIITGYPPNYFTILLETNGANRLAILSVSNYSTGGNATSVTSVTSTGLTWTELASQSVSDSFYTVQSSVWTASVPTMGTYMVTVNGPFSMEMGAIVDAYYGGLSSAPVIPVVTANQFSTYAGATYVVPQGVVTPAYNSSWIVALLAGTQESESNQISTGYTIYNTLEVNIGTPLINEYSNTQFAAGVQQTAQFSGFVVKIYTVCCLCLNIPQPPTILMTGGFTVGCANVQALEASGTTIGWEVEWADAYDGMPTCTLDDGTLVGGHVIGTILAPGATVGANLTYGTGNIDAPVSVYDYYTPPPYNYVGNALVKPTVTTTYTITAVNLGGTTTQTVTITWPSEIVCLWAIPTNLVCSDITAGSELTWFCYGTTSQSINQGIGSVSATGSETVYPLSNTTWTLTAQPGSATATASVTIDISVCLPTVDGSPVQWNGGASYAAGPYLITCCGGAYAYNPAGYAAGYGWTINGDTDNTHGYFYQVPNRGFYLYSGSGSPPPLSSCTMAPGNRTNYATVAACTTANLGIDNLFYHTGGPISLFLWDFPYWDNELGSMPPSFGIAGPGPVIAFSASSTVFVNAGTSVTLSWNVLYASSVSIDNGIGSVASTGTTVVSPTTTTTYNLTAIGTGITQYASVTVDVYVPTAPTNLRMVSACNSQIGLSWTPGEWGTSQIIQRSTDGATWTTVGTVATGVDYYLDTVPSRGTTYYYHVINTDGHNPAVSASYGVSAVLLPLVATNVAATTSALTVTITWTPSDNNPFNIYRNGSLLNSLPMYGSCYKDFGPLVDSTTYTYMVQSVNQCGDTVNSNTITATPQLLLNAYRNITATSGGWT